MSCLKTTTTTTTLCLIADMQSLTKRHLSTCELKWIMVLYRIFFSQKKGWFILMHGPQTRICLGVLARDTQEFRLAGSIEFCLSILYALKTECVLWYTVELCAVPHIQQLPGKFLHFIQQVSLNTCAVGVTLKVSLSSLTGVSFYSYGVVLEVRGASYF